MQKIMMKARTTINSESKPNSYRSEVMLYIWWHQNYVVYYEMLKFTETIVKDHYRQQLGASELGIEGKLAEYAKRYGKGIFQCQRSSRSARIRYSNPPVVFTRFCYFCFTFVSIHAELFLTVLQFI